MSSSPGGGESKEQNIKEQNIEMMDMRNNPDVKNKHKDLINALNFREKNEVSINDLELGKDYYVEAISTPEAKERGKKELNSLVDAYSEEAMPSITKAIAYNFKGYKTLASTKQFLKDERSSDIDRRKYRHMNDPEEMEDYIHFRTYALIGFEVDKNEKLAFFDRMTTIDGEEIYQHPRWNRYQFVYPHTTPSNSYGPSSTDVYGEKIIKAGEVGILAPYKEEREGG